MKAVVIAAGEGTRMRPLTARRPKPMLPAAGKPLLAHVLDACAPHVDGFVVVVGYRAEDVRAGIGTEYAGLPVEYVTQDEQLGTAHAVAQVRGHVDERFLVLNGDVAIPKSLVASLADADGTAMAVKPVDDPRNYGVVEREGDRVVDIVEKPDDPPSNLANLGLYAFEPAIFEHVEATELSARGEYEITETIERFIAAGGDVTATTHHGFWLDVGRPWELLAANAFLLEERATVEVREHESDSAAATVAGDVETGATLQGTVIVEEGARVRDGAYVEGPVLIQSGADVGPNAYVRGATTIGPSVRVGHAVEIKNSILMADTAVGHLSYVGDSVLGSDVNFGAGTVVANLRHDEENVRMRVKGDSVDTGRRKLGVVVGDGVKTGIDTNLNAGVKLGADARTTPGETVTRDVETE